MALYGNLRVNGRNIGSWGAERGKATTPGAHIYRTEVALNGQVFRSTVEHKYTDGAAVLASKVLATATNPDLSVQPPLR